MALRIEALWVEASTGAAEAEAGEGQETAQKNKKIYTKRIAVAPALQTEVGGKMKGRTESEECTRTRARMRDGDWESFVRRKEWTGFVVP